MSSRRKNPSHTQDPAMDHTDDPHTLRDRAKRAVERGREIQRQRELSGEWEWVQIDTKTRVFKRKNQN